jgi:putative selenate reductase
VRVKGFRDEAQIVHIDAFCNECGNCATFCPWDGRPYRDKLTVYDREEDFRDSENPGFFLRGGSAVARIGGRELEIALDGPGNLADDTEDHAVRAVVHAIIRDHPYLLGGESPCWY